MDEQTPLFIHFLDLYKNKTINTYGELIYLLNTIDNEYKNSVYNGAPFPETSPYLFYYEQIEKQLNMPPSPNLFPPQPPLLYQPLPQVFTPPAKELHLSSPFTFNIHSHGYGKKKCNSKCKLSPQKKTISLEPSHNYFTYMSPVNNNYVLDISNSAFELKKNNFMANEGVGVEDNYGQYFENKNVQGVNPTFQENSHHLEQFPPNYPYFSHPSGAFYGGMMPQMINEVELSTMPIIEKKMCIINEKIDTIDDILFIINKYPVSNEIKYNIDVENLAKIKTELEELNAMIGMKELKTAVINQLIYFIQELHLSPLTTGKEQIHDDYKHTVIYGPPGTGKTEIAKIIGNMYSKVGILKKKVFKKVCRNDLIAGYLGQTALKTKGVINDTLGGVLFIDEAYSLSNMNDTDSFAKECIDTLCESLSSHKEDLMVIIAGYEKELNDHFFSANQGLDSRFIWRFKIDKYTANELYQIFIKKVNMAGWKISTDKNNINTRWFEENYTKFKNYGRDMEQLFFYTKICHSKRVYGLSPESKRIITDTDINAGMKMFLENQKKDDSENVRKMMEMLYV